MEIAIDTRIRELRWEMLGLESLFADMPKNPTYEKDKAKILARVKRCISARSAGWLFTDERCEDFSGATEKLSRRMLMDEVEADIILDQHNQ